MVREIGRPVTVPCLSGRDNLRPERGKGEDRAMDITVVKIEIEGEKIEIEFSDGSEEEIEAGIYERKDPSGDTVEERPATADDRARLSAYSVGDPKDAAVDGPGVPPGDDAPAAGDDDGTPDQGSGDAPGT